MFRLSPTFSGCPQHFQDVPIIFWLSPTFSGCPQHFQILQHFQDVPNIFRMSPTFKGPYIRPYFGPYKSSRSLASYLGLLSPCVIYRASACRHLPSLRIHVSSPSNSGKIRQLTKERYGSPQKEIRTAHKGQTGPNIGPYIGPYFPFMGCPLLPCMGCLIFPFIGPSLQGHILGSIFPSWTLLFSLWPWH